MKYASAHTGGWSEQVWCDDSTEADGPGINRLAQKRARMLPVQASLIGWSFAEFGISGNRLLPLGSRTITHRYPGSVGTTADVPQAALTLSGTVGGGPNKGKYIMRCIPDENVTNGEIDVGTTFLTRVNSFMEELTGFGWGTIVRNLSATTGGVKSIAGNVITSVPGVMPVAGNYVRLLRVSDQNQHPVIGSFRVSSVVGDLITVEGLSATVLPGGRGQWRVDSVRFAPFQTMNIGRISVKKIGSPFEKYRGRR